LFAGFDFPLFFFIFSSLNGERYGKRSPLLLSPTPPDSGSRSPQSPSPFFSLTRGRTPSPPPFFFLFPWSIEWSKEGMRRPLSFSPPGSTGGKAFPPLPFLLPLPVRSMAIRERLAKPSRHDHLCFFFPSSGDSPFFPPPSKENFRRLDVSAGWSSPAIAPRGFFFFVIGSKRRGWFPPPPPLPLEG